MLSADGGLAASGRSLASSVNEALSAEVLLSIVEEQLVSWNQVERNSNASSFAVFVCEQEEVEGAEGGQAHGVRLHAAHLRRAAARSAAVRRRLPQPNAHDRVVSVSFTERPLKYRTCMESILPCSGSRCPCGDYCSNKRFQKV